MVDACGVQVCHLAECRSQRGHWTEVFLYGGDMKDCAISSLPRVYHDDSTNPAADTCLRHPSVLCAHPSHIEHVTGYADLATHSLKE